MLVAGSMINRMGPFFVLRAEEETGANVAQIARAYAIVREVFGVRKLWRDIEALDYRVGAKVQYDTIFRLSRMVRRAVYWFLQNYAQALDVEPMVERFKPGLTKLLASIPALVPDRTGQRFERDLGASEEAGLPRPIAKRIAALALMTQALDVIELALEFRLPVTAVGRLYLELAEELRLDWVLAQIDAMKVDGRWRAMARAALRETLAREQRALLRSALGARRGASPEAALERWIERKRHDIDRVLSALDDMQMAGGLDFATLSVALKEVGGLA
jgi:glutamate dehydrogenase